MNVIPLPVDTEAQLRQRLAITQEALLGMCDHADRLLNLLEAFSHPFHQTSLDKLIIKNRMMLERYRRLCE